MSAGHDAGEDIVFRIPFHILVAENMWAIRDHLCELAEKCRRLVLDFYNVDYIGSEPLKTLIILHKRVGTLGGRLVLCNLNPLIFEVFETTKLDRVFTIRSAEELAQEGVVGLKPRVPSVPERSTVVPVILPFARPECE